MGTPPRRSDRVLAEAATKVAKAEEAIRMYHVQHSMAAEKKKHLEDENEKLRATILSMALQNASVDLRREHVQLRQTLDSYQSKIDQMREISLLSAKVVDRYEPLVRHDRRSASLGGCNISPTLRLLILHRVVRIAQPYQDQAGSTICGVQAPDRNRHSRHPRALAPLQHVLVRSTSILSLLIGNRSCIICGS